MSGVLARSRWITGPVYAPADVIAPAPGRPRFSPITRRRLRAFSANRRGVWARFEHTPFGTGRPFSRGQLTTLLRGSNFTPGASAEALFFPPSKRRTILRFYQFAEKLGRRFWPMFSGVIVIEAQKRLYQGIPVKQRASRRVFVPVLSPQGAGRAGRLAMKDEATASRPG